MIISEKVEKIFKEKFNSNAYENANQKREIAIVKGLNITIVNKLFFSNLLTQVFFSKLASKLVLNISVRNVVFE